VRTILNNLKRVNRDSFSLGLALFLITACMTLIYYINDPFVRITVDTPGYLSALQHLQAMGNPVDFFRLPTYPLFLLIIYTLAGQGNLMAVSIVQGVLFICATVELYILALLVMRQKWVAFFVGLLVGTNVILISYIKPIMTEGLSLWLLTTTLLMAVLFLKTLRYRFFWLASLCLFCLVFTRPEWILLPCLLFAYMLIKTRKKLARRTIVLHTAGALLLIYGCIGAYIVANKAINGVASLSIVSDMNIIGKMIQYRMQDEAPYNPYLSHIFDRFIREGITSPYQILGKAPELGGRHLQESAGFARAIILHHPVQFLLDSIPPFFTSLYHYYPAGSLPVPPHAPGPYSPFVNTILSFDQALYTTNILFPLCALIWLACCWYHRTRHSFCVQTMGFITLIVLYALVITTLGGYYETDYMRVHIVFDPLIILIVWGSPGLGVYQLGAALARKKRAAQG
jgi:hypothetical protein